VPPTSTGSSSPPEPPPPGRAPVRPEEIAARLEALGVRPSRRAGQSFLSDPFVPDVEVALLEASPGMPILEVGGGLGLLTEALLRRGLGPVRVVERDPRLVGHLQELLGERVEVLEGDARRIDLRPGERVIGNLPFSSASPILQRLFELRPPRVVALVQREVGERLAAAPGSSAYGRPTIQAALYGRVEAFATVPARAFTPRPEVEAVSIRFTPRPGPLPVDSPVRLESLVRRIFAWRRKQLGKTLGAVLGSPGRAARCAEAAGWPSGWARLRPETLAPEAFFALERAVAREEGAPPPTR
jgi:16S rRNA (adenine1518-N6/adenine1519-N6)-dimethyltransferase